jgi:hypothetical protein
VDARLGNNQAERVRVLESSFPEVHEAVLFNEDFVTISVLSDRLQAMRTDMSQAALVHCGINFFLGHVRSHRLKSVGQHRDGHEVLVEVHHLVDYRCVATAHRALKAVELL